MREGCSRQREQQAHKSPLPRTSLLCSKNKVSVAGAEKRGLEKAAGAGTKKTGSQIISVTSSLKR